MPTIRFALSEEYYQKLQQMADEKNQSIQDYIRTTLFQINTIFTPEEAVRRIQQGDFKNKEWTLPDVYGDSWTIERGPAGVFGKNFYNYIEDNPHLGIEFVNMGKYGRRATYKLKQGGNNNE
ncbi:MAG: hypothetical protein RSF88_08340 [Lachnospiraceae bacterium]